MLWTQIDVETTLVASDAVSNLFMENGANGVSLQEADDSTTVTAFFPNDDLMGERVIKLRRMLTDLESFGIPTGSAEIRLTRVEDADWANTWKSSFPPQRIGKHWLVVPSWEEVTPAPHECLIVLDPGMAFGTGYHATTQLVLCLLEDVLQGGAEILDLGTGSGILAIAAAKLGAAAITATDIDPQAITVAQENATINGVNSRIRWQQGNLFETIDASFDLITANILTKVLLPMIPQAPCFLKPGGRLILSGILKEEDALIQQALSHAGLRCLKSMEIEEWQAYLVG